jgi:NADH-quinone oxidoreductase subunit N
MNSIDWVVIYPELLLLVVTCVIALADLFVKSPQRTLTYGLSLVGLGAVAVLTGLYAVSGSTLVGFDGMVVSDPLGNLLKCLATLAVMVSLVYGRGYAGDRGMLKGGEYFTLALFSLLGMYIMISGHNFLILYLGLELLTLSSYAMVALQRDSARASEAAMKYFVLGALASGFLLYGLSMLYGATGSLDISRVAVALMHGNSESKTLILGVVFVVAGLGFKFGAAPFHSWVPDVYQGAPTAVTLLIAGAPKFAAFAIVIRLLVMGLLPLSFDWQQMLLVLAILSLLIGNLAAIVQTSIKRMLAFSTIAQMGFVMLGFSSGVVDNSLENLPAAYSATLFYVISYVLTTLATFGVIMMLARSGHETDDITDFAGLNQKSPLYAGVMAACMFSLAGIPPLVGFYAKLLVLQALIGTGSSFALGVAIFAVIMSLIGAFYYLRVVKVMYFDAPIRSEGVTGFADARLVLTLNGLLLLVLGILPSGLLNLSLQAIVSLIS